MRTHSLCTWSSRSWTSPVPTLARTSSQAWIISRPWSTPVKPNKNTLASSLKLLILVNYYPRTPFPHTTSSLPRTPSTQRSPPPGFPEHVALNEDLKEESELTEEFTQMLTKHFRNINLDTAATVNEAFKSIEANLDETGRKLDSSLAEPYSKAFCHLK